MYYVTHTYNVRRTYINTSRSRPFLHSPMWTVNKPHHTQYMHCAHSQFSKGHITHTALIRPVWCSLPLLSPVITCKMNLYRHKNVGTLPNATVKQWCPFVHTTKPHKILAAYFHSTVIHLPQQFSPLSILFFFFFISSENSIFAVVSPDTTNKKKKK